MRTEAIVIGIVLLVLLSSVAFGTFSYAVTTTSTGAKAATTKTHSSINAVPSNATLHSSTTKRATSQIINATTTVPACSTTDYNNAEFLYSKGVYDNGRLAVVDPNEHCITVTGTVYSSAGTKEEPDGDLHFTLQLDPQYVGLKTIGGKDITTSNNCAKGATNATGYSDVAFQTHTHTATTACDRIIVEAICHNDKPYTSDISYTKKWGDYCLHNSAKPIGPPGRIFPGDMSKVLPQGQHIKVSGRLVTDTDNKWTEIHPASYGAKL